MGMVPVRKRMMVKSANKPSAKPNSNLTLLNKKHIKKVTMEMVL